MSSLQVLEKPRVVQERPDELLRLRMEVEALRNRPVGNSEETLRLKKALAEQSMKTLDAAEELAKASCSCTSRPYRTLKFNNS